MEKILVVGAGFSKNVDFPLEKEVIPRIQSMLDHLGDKTLQLKKRIQFLWKTFFPSLELWGMSIEEILSRIDVEMKYTYERDREKYFELLNLYEYILALFWTTISSKLDEDSRTVLFKFFEKIKFPFLILSFNQDMIVENVCDEKELTWNYTENFPFVTDENISIFKSRDQYRNYELKNPDIKMLKVHGSFNWFFCWRCNKIRYLKKDDAGFFPNFQADWPFRQRHLLCDEEECLNQEDAEGQAELLPLIIAPSSIKQYDIPLIYDQFFYARENLRIVKEIIFCGYSMREEDSLAVDLFYKLSVSNRKLKKVTVIDPNKEVCNHISDLMHFEAQHVKSLDKFMST